MSSKETKNTGFVTLETRSPQSTTSLVLTIILVIVNILVVGAVAWWFHTACHNDWFMAILKSIGVQCISVCILIAVASPFLIYAKERGSMTAAKIAYNISPMSLTGSALTTVLALALVYIFTRDCLSKV